MCENTLRDFTTSLSCVPLACHCPFASACRHNFVDKVKIRMGAVKAHTWKELVEQAKIAEKSAKKFESPLQNHVGNQKQKPKAQLNLLIYQH